MRLSRAELAVLVYVSSLAIAAGVSWWSSMIVSDFIRGGNESLADQAALAAWLSKLVSALLATAALSGLVWLYPAIRRDARERGRLAKESSSYMHAALTDPLTGLQNRRYFDDALEEYMREFSAIDRPLGMMIVDLDHFKTINDTFGHSNGDLVLRAVSLCLLQHTRYHDVLARVGGEEFAVIVPNTDEHSLERMAERIRAAVAELPIVLNESRVSLTASFGIAIWDGEEDAAALIKRTDANLYRAKSGGRNRVAAAEMETIEPTPDGPSKPIFGTG